MEAAPQNEASTAVTTGTDTETPEHLGEHEESTEEPSAETSAEGAAAAIADLERSAAFHLERAQEQHTWLDEATVAGLHLRLARLTGRFEHYGHARDAIARAYAIAPEGSGPHQKAAQVDFTLHRFDQAEAHLRDLESGVVLSDRAMVLRDMRADIALARGEYTAVTLTYEAMLQERRSTSNLTRVAALRGQTGHLVEADSLFVEAIEATTQDRGFHQATLELQRGLMDLSLERFTEARAHYEAANEAFPGWYLVQEHLAEVLCELDLCHRAAPLYADVVERTQSPELMSAYAATLAKLDRDEEAAHFRELADARWEVLLEQFPEALGGHGLEHFLEVGPAPRALSLAQANATLRPDGPARTLLAQAYLGTHQVAEAVEVIEGLLSTPYRTPDFLEVAAEVFEAAGQSSQAAAQVQAREALIAPFIAEVD